MKSFQLCSTHQSYLYVFQHILFLRSLTRDFQGEMKIEQNYLDGSAFAIVLPRAKYGGTAVLKMLFCTPNVSFNIDLRLMTSGTEKKNII